MERKRWRFEERGNYCELVIWERGSDCRRRTWSGCQAAHLDQVHVKLDRSQVEPHRGAQCSQAGVMVHSMYQLGWAMGCPDIWSSITLGVSVRVFLDAINI